MNTSTVSTAASVNLRNKGLKNTGGTLIKGCVKDASTKLSIGSIPSNYEKIIYQNSSTQGFGTSQKRFYEQVETNQSMTDFDKGRHNENAKKMDNTFAAWKENNSNQQEQIDYINDMQFRLKHDNKSHSSKGFGSLIAREERKWLKQVNAAPGPGRYELSKTAQSSKKRKFHAVKEEANFSRKARFSYDKNYQSAASKVIKIDQGDNSDCDEVDEQEKVKHRDQENSSGPGPGQYEVFEQKSKNVGWKSSFKTKLDRGSYLNKNKYPGPGFYDVKLSKHAKSVIKQRLNINQQNRSQEKMEKCLKSIEQNKGSYSNNKQNINYKPPNNVPGPGSYYHDIPTFKPLYERIKISGNFMMTKKNRFNDPMDKFLVEEYQEKADQKGPDIYSYDLKSGFDSKQNLLKWPCFMSESKRGLFDGAGKRLGPGFLVSDKLKDKEERKNFHFNIKGEWF